MSKYKFIGDILLTMGLITAEQHAGALKEQAQSGETYGNILLKREILTEQQLLEAQEFTLGIPRVQLGKIDIDPEVIKLLPPQIIRKYQVLPLSRRKNILTLAMADPFNQQAIDDVRMVTNLDVAPVVASPRDLDTAIRQYLAFRMDPDMQNIVNELKLDVKANARRPKELQNIKIDEDAPVIRMVNSILAQAVQGRCSDVHIEPQANDLRVRFRVDGELYEVLSLPQFSQAAVISRIKISANMDIAEKRVPQDGRFRMEVDGREVDFRVSTLPTAWGEKAVLRILDRNNALTKIEQLGLSPQNREYLIALSKRPHGLLLVTGPTGSGKTTTLYSVLGEINSVDKNIVTLEDPIEYTLPGINQVQTNQRAGLTFAGGLRSILRQDPDVIMVGEIRDKETAQLAIRAALTGHLVLSTLHTNSAAGTIARLKDMGVEDFLLAGSLSGVVSQRLVRQLCPNCKQKYTLAEETAVKLGIPEESGHDFYRPCGCNICRQLGYQSRLALHEILAAGYKIRELINHGENSEDEIEALARQEGMITLREDGLQKARQGQTSLEEVFKVVLLEGK